MVFKITSSPYIHNQRNTQKIMGSVMLATLPGVFALWLYFGYGSLIQTVLGIICALIAETIVLFLRKQPVADMIKDNSAALTGLLLGISIPPLAPWWLIIVGTTFAIIVAKQIYGGLGHNPFNPAMVGYVVLLIAFPIQMTSWLQPDSLAVHLPDFNDTLRVIFTGTTAANETINQLHSGIDGISQATPLDTVKTGLHTGQTIDTMRQLPIYQGILAGVGWQWINVGFLIGGLFLLWRGILKWHIPVSFLLTLAFCSTIGWLVDPQHYLSPVIHLFSGATMLGAFFIVTDPVTASTTTRGRLIFGVLAGLLVWLIRSYGGYPDGVAFATLLANITVPLLDYYTRPRVYGQR